MIPRGTELQDTVHVVQLSVETVAEIGRGETTEKVLETVENDQIGLTRFVVERFQESRSSGRTCLGGNSRVIAARRANDRPADRE